MKNVEILKDKLISLTEEINLNSEYSNIQFNQQSEVIENMSLSGCNGRIWVQPFHEEFDVSLSGASLEKELTSEFEKLFNKKCDGYKQSNSTKDSYTQPYWRISDFSLVKAAVQQYSKTVK